MPRVKYLTKQTIPKVLSKSTTYKFNRLDTHLTRTRSFVYDYTKEVVDMMSEPELKKFNKILQLYKEFYETHKEKKISNSSR